MSCFSCCGIEPATTANDSIGKNSANVSIGKNSANVSIGKSRKDYTNNGKTFASIIANLSIKSTSSKRRNIAKDITNFGNSKISGIEFSFSELEAATDSFNPESQVGEGGFGRVYKGYIKRIDRVVAIKQLDRKGCQGTREFFAEVLLSSIVQQHPNIVELIGYCAEGDQRVLVYEFMAKGSLEEHLFDLPPGKQPLDWDTRMKIAEGAARGLEYLHEMSEPPVIYRDFKASNVLLDDNFNAKLCDFGLVKLGPPGKPGHLSTKVVGTYGYCAPEYASSGELTVKSDVYSFGVVFLEMITGRRVIDGERSPEEQNLVNWAEPLFKDRRNYSSMADSLFEGNYPTKGLHKALVVTAMCLQDEADARPYMGDVVTALEQIVAPKSDEEDASKHSDNGNSGLILRNDSLNDCKKQ